MKSVYSLILALVAALTLSACVTSTPDSPDTLNRNSVLWLHGKARPLHHEKWCDKGEAKEPRKHKRRHKKVTTETQPAPTAQAGKEKKEDKKDEKKSDKKEEKKK